MNLMGQDIVSLVSIELINEALAKNADKLITGFHFRENGIDLEGTFGPWQIIRGGAPKLLNVRVPIEEGRIEGLSGSKAIDLSGLALVLQLALRLIPSPSGKGGKDLRFDVIREGMLAAPPVAPIEIIDPDGRLTAMQKAVLNEAITSCLSAHLPKISYVFASVDAAGNSAFAMPNSNWRYEETGDGRAYLAIMGALDDKAGEGVDPLLVKDGAEMAFAVSKKAFLGKLLHPYLSQNFKPRASFAYHNAQQTVSLTSKVSLPELKQGIWWVRPTITELVFSLSKGALDVKAVSVSEMPLWTTFKSTVRPHMPFTVRGGKVAFTPDRNPKEEHSVGLPGALDWLIGWFVNWIVSFFDKAITSVVQSITTHMQVLNTPGMQPVRWNGVSEFRSDMGELGDCFWLAHKSG